jgi:hypothetical protein
MLRNYRVCFLRSAQQHTQQGEIESVRRVLEAMHQLIPEDTPPVPERYEDIVDALRERSSKRE